MSQSRRGLAVEKILSWMIAVAALGVATSAIHREFFGASTANQPPKSEYVSSWTRIASERVEGNPGAPIKIVEFMDLQCPFCRQFNEVNHTVLKQYPNDVALVFVHDPLAGHQFAIAAARAAECGASSGHFPAVVDALYAQQDSFGLKPWSAYAKAAGITDLASYKRCVSSDSIPAGVVAGTALAKEFHVNATPTVLLNGWRYGRPPSDTELVRAIGNLLAGKKPYSGFPSSQLIRR